MEYDVGGKIFQLTAARRRLGRCKPRCLVAAAFQLTAARRRLVAQSVGRMVFHVHFNSQAREGGWYISFSWWH